jgi:hypothetical protein
MAPSAFKTHEIVEGACVVCGARASWAIIQDPCPMGRPDASAFPVSLSDFGRVVEKEFKEFRTWWRLRAHPETLPSSAEWFAEFSEWRRKSKPRGGKSA